MGVVFSNENRGFSAFFDSDAEEVSRAIAAKGGDRMVEWTIKNTPIDSGNLRTSWYQLPTEKVRHLLGPAYQSGVETQVEYAQYVEHGTGLWGPSHRKYRIAPKDPNGFLRWKDRKTGDWVYAKAVMHPGSPGQHMVAIAAEMTEHEFEEFAEPLLMAWARHIESAGD